MKIRSVLKIAAALAVVGVAVVALAIWRIDAMHWRAQVLWLVLKGDVPDLSVGDAAKMVLPGSGYWLANLPETHNAYASITNPFASLDDAKAGGETFRTDCAGCHGANAGGGTGPSLVNRTYNHGDSDWALLRTIKHGVPGTAMPSHDWDYKRIWQTVAYIRSMDTARVKVGADSVPALTADIKVTPDELKSIKEPGADWLTYSGSYSGTRHSALTQINRGNAANLAPKWVHQFRKLGERIQMTPIVRNGVMFVTHSGSVIALDARNGKTIWEFNRELPPDALSCCGVTNRGVAILDDKLFVGTIDAKLIALSAQTGKKLWETSVAPDYAKAISITGAPLAFGTTVVTGAGGGDYPNRGFIAAFDAATGKEKWRFNTIPGPGEAGHDTWPAGEMWKTGGGATWLTGSYDAERDIVLWGTGNPAPNHNADYRKGDNLYTDSVVALRGATGEKLWHFQFTPADAHDWDSVQIPVLIERPQNDAPRQLIWANRNGFFYALNRDNGKFLYGAPYVNQTWAKGLDPNGRPIRIDAAMPSPSGTLVYPGVQGATNWWSPSYDAQLDLMFVPALQHAGLYFVNNKSKPEDRQLYLSGFTQAAPGIVHYQEVVAIKASDGSVAWRHRGQDSLDDDLHLNGLVSTAGGVLFAADDQLFYALDSRDGKPLWSFPTGARIGASPMSYQVDGEQYVAISSGRMLLAFGLVGAK